MVQQRFNLDIRSNAREFSIHQYSKAHFSGIYFRKKRI